MMRISGHQLGATVQTQDSQGRQPVQLYTTRYGPIDKQAIRAQLAQLAGSGSVTARDERILEYLRELHVLSAEQLRRLFWTTGSLKTVRNRMSKMVTPALVRRARVPDTEMTQWGLTGRVVYALGVGGWMWLKEEVDSNIMDRALRREQVLHDLLVAEICVRMLEAAAVRGQDWSISWAGEEATSFCQQEGGSKRKGNSGEAQVVIAPDGLAVVTQQQEDKKGELPMFIELDKGREAHSMPHTDWGRKVVGYNRFYESDWRMHPQLADLPEFPAVAVVTHGARRLLNLVDSIVSHRKHVAYYLALWSDLMAVNDILSAPAWLMITPDGEVVGREREQRQRLLPAVDG